MSIFSWILIGLCFLIGLFFLLNLKFKFISNYKEKIRYDKLYKNIHEKYKKIL